MTHVQQTLDVLCHYYADRNGQAHRLNETQAAVYLDGLARFDAAHLEAAARAHMRQSEFFPKLSELLALLAPTVDAASAAHLAWTAVERAIRSAGSYRGVTFADGAIGATVQQVFGSWPHACSYDWDSPGWAIRRQSFLAIYPTIAARHTGEPVTVRGLSAQDTPQLVGHLAGLPAPSGVPALPAEEPVSREDATAMVGAVRGRFQSLREVAR